MVIKSKWIINRRTLNKLFIYIHNTCIRYNKNKVPNYTFGLFIQENGNFIKNNSNNNNKEEEKKYICKVP